MMRTVAWLLASLLLLGTGARGVYEGMTQWDGARTMWQKSVTGGVLLYGLLGLAAGVGLLQRLPWSYRMAIGWGIVVTYVAGAATIAYGGAGAGAAAAASGVTALIAVCVAAAARMATRTRRTAGASPASHVTSHEGRNT